MNASRAFLIVEDEPLIAMMLEDYLDLLGHRVVAAVDNVAAGLSVLSAGDVEAAILDLNLRGGERSTAIADELATRGIPFVFATGGSNDTIPPAHQHRPTLAKPFTSETIEAALEGI